MEYEVPPVDSTPMDEDDDDEDDDDDEVTLHCFRSNQRQPRCFSSTVIVKIRRSHTIQHVMSVVSRLTQNSVRANVGIIFIANVSASLKHHKRYSARYVQLVSETIVHRTTQIVSLLERLVCSLCEEDIVENQLQCGYKDCRRVYHANCLLSSSLLSSPSPNVNYCPIHVCATCRLHKRPQENIGNIES
jgi:hypothetical protein